MTKQEKLEAWEHHLRDEHRIKKGVDYCYTIKQGGMRVLTDVIWLDQLYEHAQEYGIKVEGWFSYS